MMKQYVAAGLLALGILVGACVPNPFTPKASDAVEPYQYEYEVVDAEASNSALQKQLNDKAFIGWEPVQIRGDQLILRRQKR